VPRKKPKIKDVQKLYYENETAEIGKDGVEQIVTYLEADGSLWFKVYANGGLARAINGNIAKFIDY